MTTPCWSAVAAGANARPCSAAIIGEGVKMNFLIRKDAAKIRAFFVHPQWARRGIGSKILEICEHAAMAAGFQRFEMGTTLTGVPLYQARGYVEIKRTEVPLANGASLPVVRMAKAACRS